MHVFPLFLTLVLSGTPSIPAGTRVEARLQSPVDTKVAVIGQEVDAILVKPIEVGKVTLAAEGSRLHGRIETVAAATRTNGGRVRIVFRELELPDGRRTPTWITEGFAATSPNHRLRYLLYTAFGGAAGAFAGGRTMRASGTIGGGLIGLIIATNSSGARLPDLKLKPGRILHLQLGEDLLIP